MIGHLAYVQSDVISTWAVVREPVTLTEPDGSSVRAWMVEVDCGGFPMPLLALDAHVFALDGIEAARVAPGGWC